MTPPRAQNLILDTRPHFNFQVTFEHVSPFKTGGTGSQTCPTSNDEIKSVPPKSIRQCDAKEDGGLARGLLTVSNGNSSNRSSLCTGSAPRGGGRPQSLVLPPLVLQRATPDVLVLVLRRIQKSKLFEVIFMLNNYHHSLRYRGDFP